MRTKITTPLPMLDSASSAALAKIANTIPGFHNLVPDNARFSLNTIVDVHALACERFTKVDASREQLSDALVAGEWLAHLCVDSPVGPLIDAEDSEAHKALLDIAHAFSLFRVSNAGSYATCTAIACWLKKPLWPKFESMSTAWAAAYGEDRVFDRASKAWKRQCNASGSVHDEPSRTSSGFMEITDGTIYVLRNIRGPLAAYFIRADGKLRGVSLSRCFVSNPKRHEEIRSLVAMAHPVYSASVDLSSPGTVKAPRANVKRAA